MRVIINGIELINPTLADILDVMARYPRPFPLGDPFAIVERQSGWVRSITRPFRVPIAGSPPRSR